MANVVTFLKNYKDFGFKVRYVTAKNYLNTLLTTTDFVEKKIMLIRITEEVISSTEDLTMWLAAINNRNNLSNKCRDIWEYLINCWATDEEVLKILKQYSRVKTGKGLLTKFKTPPVVKILTYLKTDEVTFNKLLDKLLESIKASLHNRTAGRKVLLKFHNKIKHGMVVQDYGNELYIREIEANHPKKGKRLYGRNRNLYIPFDVDKAKSMVGTVEANAYAVKTLVILLMADITYQLETKKRKLGKRQRIFWEESLRGY